jgi:hypothetical protein
MPAATIIGSGPNGLSAAIVLVGAAFRTMPQTILPIGGRLIGLGSELDCAISRSQVLNCGDSILLLEARI